MINKTPNITEVVLKDQALVVQGNAIAIEDNYNTDIENRRHGANIIKNG